MILIFILFMGKLRLREVQSFFFGGGRGLTQLGIREISSKAVVKVLTQDNKSVCLLTHQSNTLYSVDNDT